uniref:RNA helicase n=1 Tax=Sphenodon punctatus TaxID=8508 RepID=A0A8D0G5Z2_SPHPU
MTAEEKQNLISYRRYIEKTLNPVYVLGDMKAWLCDVDIERIEAGESQGLTAAAVVFLDIVLKLESDGWFRGFLDALHAAGYTGLYEAIETWDFSKIESLEEHRQLLKRIEATLREIDVTQILPYVNECLINRECEEILQVIERKGRAAGVAKLVDCLCRSDKENWPKIFQLALEQTKYSHASNLWNMTEDNNECDLEMEDDQEEDDTDLSMQYSEEAESPNFSERQSSLPVSQQTVTGQKQARSYQNELAQPAFRGKHTIICAPTGSGKTFVALMICENHLTNMPPGQKGKVVFLATKVPVYEQQKSVFEKHFERTKYKVTGICGETASDAPVLMTIERNDIIVLTPQILVNILQDGTISSLGIFTLMIFDECHNTIGSHPYNVLMSSYLDLKFDQPARSLPQIVGLTASVGIGSAKNLKDTIEYICNLCANLNVQVISTVKENFGDLKKFVYMPEKIIRLIKMRPKNQFVEIISEMMSKTETLARSLYSIGKRTGLRKYEQWIVNTQKKCRVLQLQDKEEESKICRALFIYTEHLRKYNDALIINEDARIQDALAYLKEFFENIRSAGFDEIEQELATNFEDKLQELNEVSNDESNENPKLEDLTFILNEEYRQNPQTRTLLFVKTRALVAALKNWLEENPKLQHLKPDVLMGRSNRNQKTGMTLPNQKDVLNSFRTNGDHKILIATSVADEGIDIAQCNLVLLYEYTGNVTKMIQVRGRGRAKDSKCILVTSKKEHANNEQNNIYKEEMMNKAIMEIQKWDEERFVRKISDLQNGIKKMLDSKKKAKPQPQEGNKRFLCGKCKTFACTTEDIRVIEVAHHTVIGEFKKRFLTQPHKKPGRCGIFEKKCKIYCKKPRCQHDWGITAKYKTFDDIPVIKIESFVVEDMVTGNQDVFRKWKDANFAMKEFDVAEMAEA